MTKVTTGYLQVTIFWAQSNKIAFILLTAHNIVDTNCWHVQGTAICKAFKFFPEPFPVSRLKEEIGRQLDAKVRHFASNYTDILAKMYNLIRQWTLLLVSGTIKCRTGPKRTNMGQIRTSNLRTSHFQVPFSFRGLIWSITFSCLDRPLWSVHFRLDLPRALATCSIDFKDLFKTNSFLKDLKNLNRFLIRELRPELFLKDFSY